MGEAFSSIREIREIRGQDLKHPSDWIAPQVALTPEKPSLVSDLAESNEDGPA